MTHHGEKFRLGTVGRLSLFTRADQLLHCLLLLRPGAFQGFSQAVDIAHQLSDLMLIGDLQPGAELPFLQFVDGQSHTCHWVG